MAHRASHDLDDLIGALVIGGVSLVGFLLLRGRDWT